MFASGKTAAVASAANYIEDVFSTYLYTGNGSTQTITNGIDLSTYGGLVWIKARSGSSGFAQRLIDTARGASNFLESSSTDAQSTNSFLSAFNANGFSLNGAGAVNFNTNPYASWTFRKQPKFFDVVTYTGNDVIGRQIPHNLGSVPGCIIVKQTNAAREWAVYHTSLGNTQYINLNTAGGAQTQTYWNNTSPTSTNFTVGDWGAVNGGGNTYVAYLFAHNAGGFGLTGTDNVISCGSAADGNSLVTLGYEPQWVLIKGSQGSIGVGDNWLIADAMRGMVYSGNTPYLAANLSSAEDFSGGGGSWIKPTATGFQLSNLSGTGPFIYIAIRRGPMKVPTSGTSVFSPNTTTNDTVISTTGFPVDLCIEDIRTPSSYPEAFDRLRGSGIRLLTSSTDAEGNTGTNPQFQSNTGVTPGRNGSGVSCILWNFQRAPSFFDEVCYTGTGVAGRTVTHNLTVAPELMIVKGRSNAGQWRVYSSALGATQAARLNSTDSFGSNPYAWNNTAPTASVFTVGDDTGVNENTYTYVAYLFATCAGVSKVFSYTGNGSSQTINCGFTGGARWILIKRTDSTGDWYVWDSARGIVSGNDPHLSLNTTAAEVTTDDTIDTDSTGFVVNQVSATNVNVSSATYIGIAIA